MTVPSSVFEQQPHDENGMVKSPYNWFNALYSLGVPEGTLDRAYKRIRPGLRGIFQQAIAGKLLENAGALPNRHPTRNPRTTGTIQPANDTISPDTYDPFDDTHYVDEPALDELQKRAEEQSQEIDILLSQIDSQQATAEQP